MIQRQITTVDGPLAALLRSVERLARRIVTAAPASRPVGGPVVFRHYL